MTLYEVKHCFDVDGGFGDAISEEETITIFSTKEKAEAFVKKYSNPHVYQEPYDKLMCGLLQINEIEADEELDEYDMWWLEKGDEENDT